MRNQLKDAQEKLVRLWEQVVLLHQRMQRDPSIQCAWTLTKLILRLVFELVRLYILFH